MAHQLFECVDRVGKPRRVGETIDELLRGRVRRRIGEIDYRLRRSMSTVLGDDGELVRSNSPVTASRTSPILFQPLQLRKSIPNSGTTARADLGPDVHIVRRSLSRRSTPRTTVQRWNARFALAGSFPAAHPKPR